MTDILQRMEEAGLDPADNMSLLKEIINTMNTALWIAQILLALMYVTAGILKTFVTSKAKEQMAWG